MNSHERAMLVKERALAIGFSAAGITDLGPNSHGAHLQRWLSRGMAGTMTYMHRQAARRLEPVTILPGAIRAIVVMRNHFSVEPVRSPGTGRVAKYARGTDYHEALRIPLQQLVAHVMSLGDGDTIARAFVDAGPVPERELAQRAGLGWIGRNTMLIHPRLGSYQFLATVLTNLELAVDRPFAADRCGTCRRCADSCPTGAILADRMVDSRRCISYLTIEKRGEIAEELHRSMGDWVFGCDICQDMCPWNVKFASPANDALLSLDPRKGEEDLEYLCEASQESFEKRFAQSPLRRPGVDGMRRNACIALKNLGADGSAVIPCRED